MTTNQIDNFNDNVIETDLSAIVGEIQRQVDEIKIDAFHADSYERIYTEKELNVKLFDSLNEVLNIIIENTVLKREFFEQ